jgi:hypothetical protein
VIEVVQSAIPETLAEGVINTIVESSTEALVIETTSSGPDILAETFTTDIVVDLQAQQLVATEIDTNLVETAEQGPPGPRGSAAASYPGKTLVWATGVLQEVLLYLDAAKTQLAERRVLNRTGSVLESIQYFSGAGTLTSTRTLTYTTGVLTGVTES